jgi:AcrR family transcriptional regulator
MKHDRVGSAPAKRRSQAERRDESERLLLEATLDVVAREGVAAATFDSIGRAAGYSRGLATQRFGSKQGLIEAVIAHLHRERDTLLEEEHVSELPALDALVRYVDTYMRDLDRDAGGRAYFMLMASSIADLSEMRAAFAAAHERVGRWLEALIRRGQKEGNIRADIDPASGAIVVGSLLIGLSVQWLVDPSTDLQPLRAASIAAMRHSFEAEPKGAVEARTGRRRTTELPGHAPDGSVRSIKRRSRAAPAAD